MRVCCMYCALVPVCAISHYCLPWALHAAHHPPRIRAARSPVSRRLLLYAKLPRWHTRFAGVWGRYPDRMHTCRCTVLGCPFCYHVCSQYCLVLFSTLDHSSVRKAGRRRRTTKKVLAMLCCMCVASLDASHCVIPFTHHLCCPCRMFPTSHSARSGTYGKFWSSFVPFVHLMSPAVFSYAISPLV